MVMELTRMMEEMNDRLERLHAEAQEMRRRINAAREQTALVRLRDIQSAFGDK
jgi:molecular chaperone GrpE (heat shock protein)